METKSTDKLQSELMSQPNLDEYIKENAAFFAERRIVDLLTELYNKKNISKAELARQAGISEIYLHQVFSGRRKPSRDRLLCICIGLEATLEETQTLLKQASFAQLYPRIRREAIICHSILHGTPLAEINDTLFARNEKTLY
jgi:transcriptional regulator with XRE-family HTH domain